MGHSIDEGDTRTSLARALKQELAAAPLDRVTVSGLVRRVGITRQAFYYHFSDVTDLAVWTFKEEVADQVLAHRSRARWADGFLQTMSYMQDHRDQAYAVLEALSWRELERFLFSQLRLMMAAIVDEVEEDLAAESGLAPRLRDHDRQFIVDHYTLTVNGHLMHWLSGGMKADPVGLVDDLEVIMDGAVARAIRRMARARPAV